MKDEPALAKLESGLLDEVLPKPPKPEPNPLEPGFALANGDAPACPPKLRVGVAAGAGVGFCGDAEAKGEAAEAEPPNTLGLPAAAPKGEALEVESFAKPEEAKAEGAVAAGFCFSSAGRCVVSSDGLAASSPSFGAGAGSVDSVAF